MIASLEIWSQGALEVHRAPCPFVDDGDHEEYCSLDCDGGILHFEFTAEDVGKCTWCKRKEVPIRESLLMNHWFCVACAVLTHKERCGCSLWKSAEADLLEGGGE